MSNTKKNIKFKFTIALALVLQWSNFLAEPAYSRYAPLIAQLDGQHLKQKEPDGSKRGRPGGRTGTGSRGDCPSVNLPLTALIPANNQGLTIAEYPRFWIFVPNKSNKIISGEFVLQDETDNDVYRTNFHLPATPGIVTLNLEKTTPLQINKQYQWYFKLYCSQQKFSNPLFVRGWIQRIAIDPNLKKQLKAAATPEQRFNIYYRNNIWYEAVTELAERQLIKSQNNSLLGDWDNLLKRIGLEYLISQPIVGEVKI